MGQDNNSSTDKVHNSVATILTIYRVSEYFYKQYDTLNTFHVMIQVPISSRLS